MFVRVVANVGAGSGDGGPDDQLPAEITAAFTAAGATCEVTVVTGDRLEQALRDAAEAGPDAVVVAGGDGTLGTAAGVLADGEVPLGILPLGTFNHFAKDLGLPIDIAEAAATIVGGDQRSVDVGEVNGRSFVNNSSIGVYPTMVALRDQLRDERGWGKVRAVPVAVVRVLRRFPARRLTIDTVGYRDTLRTPFVFVGNNRYDIGPGGIGRRETIAGGELCVYVARPASRARLVLLAVVSLVRGAGNLADLDVHCGPDITVEAGTHRLRVAIDGEVTTLRAPLRYRVRPSALSVLVPAATDVPTGASPVDESGAEVDPWEPGS